MEFLVLGWIFSIVFGIIASLTFVAYAGWIADTGFMLDRFSKARWIKHVSILFGILMLAIVLWWLCWVCSLHM
jgi:ABC-type phosphate transport system permease subunit